jgi:hypothetical protein
LRFDLLEEHAKVAVFVAAPTWTPAPTWDKSVTLSRIAFEMHSCSSVYEIWIRVAYAALDASSSGGGGDGCRSEGEEGEDGCEALHVDHICWMYEVEQREEGTVNIKAQRLSRCIQDSHVFTKLQNFECDIRRNLEAM